MRSTLDELNINGEVLDMTEYATTEEVTKSESNVTSAIGVAKEEIIGAVSHIETKVDEGVATLSNKIDNIDLSSVAKQGENQEATNSKIYAMLGKINGIFDEYALQLHDIIGE